MHCSASCYEQPGPIITDLSHSWDDCCMEPEYPFPCLEGAPLMSRDYSIVHLYFSFYPFVLDVASDFNSQYLISAVRYYEEHKL